ncbi:hypothetical protein NECAME_11807 [Necator americanus]|uniref:Uncharacterized protein n=1 Tax=Necator americanus TaxID=51031 RepID=W2T2K8_NECAM|nr:hypothetical protein NECAME_11807 [Necator americanus]ETN76240.1 hypothetical protein NECAME_11807 [Necator americanus]
MRKVAQKLGCAPKCHDSLVALHDKNGQGYCSPRLATTSRAPIPTNWRVGCLPSEAPSAPA